MVPHMENRVSIKVLKTVEFYRQNEEGERLKGGHGTSLGSLWQLIDSIETQDSIKMEA